MTVSLKHQFVSNVADSPDATLVQPSNWNAEHTLTANADSLLGAVTAGNVTEITCTSAGRALLDDADASAQRTTLGLGTISTQNANNVSITGGTIVANASGISIRDADASNVMTIAVGSNLTTNTTLTLTTGASSNRTLDISATNVTVSVAGAALIDDADAAAQRTTLGLGTIATQNSNNVSITGGSITGITDLAVADGGTGASDAATARTNLGIGTLGTQNANAVAITGGTIVANASGISIRDADASNVMTIAVGSNLTANTTLTLTTGATTNRTLDISATNVTVSVAGAALIDDADAAAQRTTLGLGTTDSPQFAAVNVGNATDTTITRVSAGVIAVEGKTVVTETGGQTVQFAAGSNTAPSITTTGDTNTGIYFPAADTTAITTGGTERMRINSSGNVGIGTSSPSFKFEVQQGSSSASPSLRQTPQAVLKGYAGAGTYHSGIGFSMFEHTNGYWGSGIIEVDDVNYYGAAMAFYTSEGSATPTPSERMRIDSSGNVGIGTSSPATLLHVNGTIRYTNRPAAGTITAIGYDTNGDLTNSSSSLRYKYDVQDYGKGLAEVMQLRPVSFKFNGESRENSGFIAEEIDAAGLSEIMLYDEDGRPDGVLYANMVALLTKAIQELKADFDAYKSTHP